MNLLSLKTDHSHNDGEQSMKRLGILAAAVAVLLFGSFAGAQQRGGKDRNTQAQEAGQERGQQKRGGQKGGGGGGLFRLLDVDRDGNLSAKEIDRAVTALMKLDRNKDGVLDAQELTVRGRGGRTGQGGKGGQNKGPRNQSSKSGN